MSASTPILFRPEVPPSIWGRSGRPRWATVIRVYIAFSLIWIGFFFEHPLVRGSWIGAGIVAFLVFPRIIRVLLRPLEREVAGATRRNASHCLGLLRERRIVRIFAPHAWLKVQEAKLHLIAGDGLAAARAFAEIARLSGLREPSANLLGAQTHAFLVANDLKQAGEVSDARMKLGEIGPWDRLHQALILLANGRRSEAVVKELSDAREQLGDDPWVLAALTLAYERSGALPEALAIAEVAKAAADDELAKSLLKRAEKGLRAYRKSLQQKQRKSKSKASRKASDPHQETHQGSLAPGKAKDRRKPRGSKKARKQARREARRRAKAEERQRRAEGAARRKREMEARARSAQAGVAAREVAAREVAAREVTAREVTAQISADNSATPVRRPARSEVPKPAQRAPAIAREGVVLPPLVRVSDGPAPVATPVRLGSSPGSGSAAAGFQSRSASEPPPVPSASRLPAPPQLNLPRLVGNKTREGLPTRSAKPAARVSQAAVKPQVAATTQVVPAPQVVAVAAPQITAAGDTDEWGDLDALFQE
ncbi:MAG TPA: hypothetical protein ENJ18_05845 [Nannocystis exedens]|nr:hypothetical protein [Nannocystis exedens]